MTTTLIRDVTVPMHGELVPHQDILIRNGNVAEIAPAGSVDTEHAPGMTVLHGDGGLAIPGFVEAHTHLVMFGQSLAKVQLHDCQSLSAIGARLQAARAKDADARYLLGIGWHPEALDGREPTASMLDEYVSDVPVLLDAHDLHSAWVNTSALQAMGVAADTPDPAGGRIGRDEHGRPNGYLEEGAAVQFAWQFVATTMTDAERDAHLERAFSHYLDAGVVGATEMALSQPDADAFCRILAKTGRLPFPVAAYVLVNPTRAGHEAVAQVEAAARLRDAIEAKYGNEWFRIVGIKLIADGVIDSCTAAMVEPFTTGAHPTPLWEFAAARAAVVRADSLGLDLAIHAIGDAASGFALDLVRACVAENGPKKSRRPRFEHLESIADATIAAMAKLGVIASMQPVHCDPSIMENWMQMLGHPRSESGFPWHKFREAGVGVVLGTDAPTAPHFPTQNLFIATTALSVHSPELDAYHPERVFTITDAIQAMTVDAAAAGKLADRTGSLEVGGVASIAVYDRSPDPANLRDWCGANLRSLLVLGDRVR